MKRQSKSTYRSAILGGICAAGFVLSGPSFAWDDPVTYLPNSSDVQFKYNNLETVVSQVGDSLTGIFAISSIGDPSGTPTYWASGLSGSELNGVFHDLVISQITPTVGGYNIYFTGGSLEMYNVANGSYNPSGPADSIDQQICGAAACPDAWLTFDFVPGIVTVDDPATVGFDETTTTLLSTVTALTEPLTGTGDGNLLVTGGTAAWFFNPEMSLQSNLQDCTNPGPNFAANCNSAGDWPLASFDPVVGSTADVPEPNMIVLMGAGLLGFGLVGRLRKKA